MFTQNQYQQTNQDHSYELRFNSLFDGRALSFPCDSHGDVMMDTMTEKARMNYMFARAMLGRDYAYPVVVMVH